MRAWARRLLRKPFTAVTFGYTAGILIEQKGSLGWSIAALVCMGIAGYLSSHLTRVD